MLSASAHFSNRARFSQGKFGSSTACTPANRFITGVRNEATDGSGFEPFFQAAFSLCSFDVRPFFTFFDPTIHAPTTATGTFFTEKFFQVAPESWLQLFYRNLHGASGFKPYRRYSFLSQAQKSKFSQDSEKQDRATAIKRGVRNAECGIRIAECRIRRRPSRCSRRCRRSRKDRPSNDHKHPRPPITNHQSPCQRWGLLLLLFDVAVHLGQDEVRCQESDK
jgi:hypothetical protein